METARRSVGHGIQGESSESGPERTAQDTLNRATWSSDSARHWLSDAHSSRGEDAALAHVRERLDRRPILDLGVGTGRTIPLLSPMTEEYIAIDYLQAMVDAARARHPAARVYVGDARDLAPFETGHFGLVDFSFNGLDAVSTDDRRRVLREARRVLGPGGMFLFSTLNLDGPAMRERPWHLHVEPAHNPLRYGARVVGAAARAVVDIVHWLRLVPLSEDGPGYAVAPLSAHRYGLLVHYTTLRRQLEELVLAGFSHDVVVFDNDTGRRLEVGYDTADVAWFHIVAHVAAP